MHKICISQDFLHLYCLWSLRFKSNLTSRGSLRGLGETHGLGLQEGYPAQNRAVKTGSQRQGKGSSGLALASMILTVLMFVEIAGAQ